MGTITLLDETTENPLTLIGKRAGVCWGADTSDDEKNRKRGIDCVMSDHGRTLEYVNVEMILDGYSARVIREWYTHIGGAPTRLQASTRYIDYTHFDYVIPDAIAGNEKAKEVYELFMKQVSTTAIVLNALEIPREDVGMILPLGMSTKIVDKRNLRNLIDMSRQRMCVRAYKEYRELFDDICAALCERSDEWKWIVENCMMPKCKKLGYCPEAKSCGRMPKKEN